MKIDVNVKLDLKAQLKECVADIKAALEEAGGIESQRATTVGMLKDRVRDLRYEAQLLEGVAQAYEAGVTDLLCDKRIEAYASYKLQQIVLELMDKEREEKEEDGSV